MNYAYSASPQSAATIKLGGGCASDVLEQLNADSGVYAKNTENKDDSLVCRILRCKQNYVPKEQNAVPITLSNGQVLQQSEICEYCNPDTHEIKNDRCVKKSVEKPVSSTNAGISGVVTDADTKETLIGVNIFLTKGDTAAGNGAKGAGTITGLNGDFKIENLPADAKFVQFSYMGYKTVVLPLVAGKKYDVKLQEDTNSLQDVVVQAVDLEGEDCAPDILKKLNASQGVYAKKDSKLYCDIQVCNDNYSEEEYEQTFTYTSNSEEGATTQYEVCKCLEPFKESCADGACSCNKEEEESVAEPEEVAEPVINQHETETPPETPVPDKPTDEEIKELRAKADAAHERETSTANKMLGAAGIGATGVGGMMLMQGLAEQSADDETEQQMRAYLATFNCKYGDNSAPGGATEVELPGGNSLIQLYSEYVTLANNVKSMKSELDMKPGIESESILDSATSGLYDDVSIGKTSGAFASLARAMQNPDGEDAKKWQEQTDKTSQNIKTGAITAGVGAGASLIGDIVVSAVDKKKADKDSETDESSNKQ